MIRQEQCDKVCRILDDVLANRPTERDSLIVATRKAFEALEGTKWVPCSESLPKVGERVLAQQINGAMQAMKCIDGGHLKWFYSRTVAWMPLPEPYRGGEKE